jgi:tetratricopeptide (TPR) repeat protein
LIAGDTLAFYAYKIVLPWQLGIDYGRTPQWVIEHWWHLTWIVPCAIAALVWQRREKCPWLMAAAGIFITALLPVLGLVPFRFQMYSTVADRYLYLAMLGPALGLAWFVSAIGVTAPNRIKTAWSVCVAVLCLFAVRSALQVNVWRDSMTLFQNAIQVNPRSWVAHFDLGVALHNQGDYNGAVTHFNQALQITPDYIPAYTFSGMALLRQGRTDAAIQQLQEAIKIGPNYALPHVYLSTALLARGRSEEAMDHLQTALRLMPDSPGVYANLGIALVRQNRIEEAIAAFRKSRELQTHPATTDDSLGNTLAQKRYLENAIAHELDSHYAAALNRCAIALQQQGKREEATVFSQGALRNKVNPD